MKRRPAASGRAFSRRCGCGRTRSLFRTRPALDLLGGSGDSLITAAAASISAGCCARVAARPPIPVRRGRPDLAAGRLGAGSCGLLAKLGGLDNQIRQSATPNFSERLLSVSSLKRARACTRTQLWTRRLKAERRLCREPAWADSHPEARGRQRRAARSGRKDLARHRNRKSS